MMNRIVSVALVAFLAAFATAQAPDGSLWTDVFNPSGKESVPAVIYDPANGIMFLDTRGLNGVSDTTSSALIGGDDVGFIALSLPAPAAASVNFLDGFVNQSIGGTVWTNVFFNGKQHVFGVDGIYLQPGVHYLWQFEAFLAPGAFGGHGDVELAMSFGTGQSGATTFGSVQFGHIPEPTSLTLLYTAVPGLLGFVRCHQKHRGR